MEEQSRSVRKTVKYRLTPTPAQEQALATVLSRCRMLYNAALEERKTAWERRQVSLTSSHQKAELPEIKEAVPEYADVHSQVLQAVVVRVDRAFQALFRGIQAGKKPGY